MTRKDPTIVPPKAGWKEQTYYLVEMCCNPNNPCFLAVFYTGFLNGRNNSPGGYNEIVRMDGHTTISDVVFMRALKELITLNTGSDRLLSPNYFKCPYQGVETFDLTPVI